MFSDPPCESVHHLSIRNRIVLLLIATALLAFALGRWTDSHSTKQAGVARTATTRHRSSPTTWPADDPDSLPARLAPFAGLWSWHGAHANVDLQGIGVASWRTYRWCQQDPTPPCDFLDGNLIISGGAATFDLVHVDGSVAYGYVTSTSDASTLPLGPLRIELRPDDHLSFPGLGGGPLCGPHASHDCGA